MMLQNTLYIKNLMLNFTQKLKLLIMEARINLKVQGIRGGNPMWSENKGNVTVFVNHSYQKAYNDFISVDAFQGYGNDYERRKECLVEIQSEGKTVFLGTFEELKEKLLK